MQHPYERDAARGRRGVMVRMRSGRMMRRTMVRRYVVMGVMMMIMRLLRSSVRVQVQVVAVFFGRVEM
jgi:hypothetical protein